jgi:calcium/calmodulin-dependent protein kinase I
MQEMYALSYLYVHLFPQAGYSTVRVATHRESGEQFACKVVTLPKAGRNTDCTMPCRETVMKEIDALLDLDHPNVVGLKEYFVDQSKVYLITELLRGGALLEAVLEQGHYSEADARTVFRQLIMAIQYLHSQGVVHRDVKLDNLLLVSPGDISRIKIADFGFAKKLQGGRGNAMQTVCGTSGYIAPEVIQVAMLPSGDMRSTWEQKQQHYGPPCDLWSAGVVLYMLLAGSPPFFDASEPRLLRSIMQAKYDFDTAAWDPVSGEAKDLIRKLLVVDPAQRLTCEQVLQHPWMSKVLDGGAQLPATAAAIKHELTRRRSSNRSGTLQQRIEDALRETPAGSRAATPAVSASVTPSRLDMQAAAAAAVKETTAPS